MNTAPARPAGIVRIRDGHHARVTNEELFFDLVYVFAVTQLSHTLLHHLSAMGFVQALVLWFGVWLCWQYTCWVTNWLNPEAPAIRVMMFMMMLLGLVMSSSIPDAFGERGLVFGLALAAMQVGRSLYVVFAIGPRHELAPNFMRILFWLAVSGCLWVAGSLVDPGLRLVLWIAAVACEYASPMFGFPTPGLGRSRTDAWTIEGAHLTERCQLFVIVALGETLLASGAALSEAPVWNASIMSGLLATFLGTVSMWWLYFGASARDATHAITRSSDPGRLGALYHYAHVVLVAGIIGTAVGNDLVLAHPHDGLDTAKVLALIGGPLVYLLGSAAYKAAVYGRFPISHGVGMLALLALLPVGYSVSLETMGWLTTAVMFAIGLWEIVRIRSAAVA